MYQAVRQLILSRVSQESIPWRLLKASYQPVSWAAGAAYRLTSRQLSGPPIIIGGAPRSGTTLLLSVLSAHAHIHGIAHETLAFCPPETTGRVRTPEDFQLHRVYAPLAFSRPGPECTRWCEKTPGNIRSFGAILEHFGGQVRLIHIVRDGRDATTSRHPRRPTDYYYSPKGWAEIVSDGLRFSDHPQVAVVKYEDLVLDFSHTVETLCAFLDEPVDDRILDWHRHTSVRTHTAWEGPVRAVHGSSVGRWRLPEHSAQVERFMQDATAVALLDKLGYRATSP